MNIVKYKDGDITISVNRHWYEFRELYSIDLFNSKRLIFQFLLDYVKTVNSPTFNIDWFTDEELKGSCGKPRELFLLYLWGIMMDLLENPTIRELSGWTEDYW